MGLRGRSNLIEERFFFVTTSVYNHSNVFSDFRLCDILINNIKYYQKIYKFVIIGYVIMPTHFNWIVEVEPKFGIISDVMRDIKKYSAWDIMEEFEKNKDVEMIEIFKSAAKDERNQKRKFWQKRFDDEVIRNEKMFWVKLNYIHNNHVKAGLVGSIEDYKYSSARNYVFDDQSILKVDTSMGGAMM